MAATGLDVFDKTLQTTNIWLEEIMADLGPDRKVGYRALRAVLHALRDRLSIDEAAHLGAQLPLLVRGIYFDQWRPAGKPDRVRSLDEFLARVSAELRDIRPVNAEAARAVFRTIGLHVTEGEVAQVRGQLPEEIRRLWPEKAIAAANAADRAYAGGKPAAAR
jgi:uncharacterized protein (DUF2267 family)